jgi:hypothetical protein
MHPETITVLLTLKESMGVRKTSIINKDEIEEKLLKDARSYGLVKNHVNQRSGKFRITPVGNFLLDSLIREKLLKGTIEEFRRIISTNTSVFNQKEELLNKQLHELREELRLVAPVLQKENDNLKKATQELGNKLDRTNQLIGFLKTMPQKFWEPLLKSDDNEIARKTLALLGVLASENAHEHINRPRQ